MSWLFSASRLAVRLIQPLVPHDHRGISIVAYHLVGAGTGSPVDVPLDVFRAQLQELRDCADICSLPDALARLKSGRENLRPVVVITFDDAFDNFRTHAWPLLSDLALPCTLYVPVGFLDGVTGVPLSGVGHLEALSWEALRELSADRLLTVGSHSWSHNDLRTLGTRELRWDLETSRTRLEQVIERPVEHFCYPRAKWSRPVEREVARIYSTAAIAGGLRNVAATFRPLRLARIPVRRDMPADLAPIVHSAVWLEEWAASHARAFR
jgi:peptidoglycan/xylan/chitin deacetylase (PgdA/CDA1 family)